MTPPSNLDPKNIPECEKLASSSDDMSAIRTFIEWVEGFGWHFARGHEHKPSCYEKHSHKKHGWDCELSVIAGQPCKRKKTLVCGWKEDQYESCSEKLDDLLYQFFDIDPKKLEKERRTILDRQRKANKKKSKQRADRS